MSLVQFLSDTENRSKFFLVVCLVISGLSLCLGAVGGDDAWVGWAGASFFIPGIFISTLRICRGKKRTSISQKEFKVTKSSWAAVCYVLLCSGWIVGALVILAHHPEVAIIVSLLVGFCAAGLFVSLWMFFDSKPLMVIDDEGFYDRTIGTRKIPWSEIRGAYVSSVQGTDVISLRLRDKEYLSKNKSALRSWLDRTNAAVGFELLHLGFVDLDAAYLDQAVDFIIARCDKENSGDKSDDSVQSSDQDAKKSREIIELFG